MYRYAFSIDTKVAVSIKYLWSDTIYSYAYTVGSNIVHIYVWILYTDHIYRLYTYVRCYTRYDNVSYTVKEVDTDFASSLVIAHYLINRSISFPLSFGVRQLLMVNVVEVEWNEKKGLSKRKNTRIVKKKPSWVFAHQFHNSIQTRFVRWGSKKSTVRCWVYQKQKSIDEKCQKKIIFILCACESVRCVCVFVTFAKWFSVVYCAHLMRVLRK